MGKRQTTAFTLIEVMIVTAIILVLVAISWLVIAPSMKAKSLETRIRADLRQIGIAINTYMSDNNDMLPYSMRDLPPVVPRGIGGREDHGPLAPHFSGPRDYHLVYSQRDADDTDRWNCHYKWDGTTNPVVCASFRQRVTGAQRSIANFDTTTWTEIGKLKREEVLVLSSFLDGHIAWCQDIEEWRNELMMRRAFGGR
jgi:prepilin-type N-terminal cleavage/methylation domain-containing protein